MFTNSVYTLFSVKYILKYVDGKYMQNKTERGLFIKNSNINLRSQAMTYI